VNGVPDELPPPTLQTPEPIEVIASDGGPLRLDYYEASGDTPGGRGVILCHGFRGYKDWGFIRFLATRLAEEGLPAVAFNFASSGITDRDGTFGEPERFRRGTYGGDLADLARISDWLADRIGAPSGARLGLAGHSRGGVIAVLHAARDSRVRAVATLGSPARIGVWPDSYWASWRQGEAAELYDYRTKQTLRLGPELFRDWEANAGLYDTQAILPTLAAPVLVVHGARDALVPLSEAEEFVSFGRSTSVELRVVEGAGHSFQAGDTIRRTPPPLLDAVESVAAWMRRWLQPNPMRDYFLSGGGV
jgi:pimeloyl-ACP methyl ester carboxylesterase